MPWIQARGWPERSEAFLEGAEALFVDVADSSMLAQRIASILPPLSGQEATEVTRIHSIMGAPADALAHRPPFRSPHHSITAAGLVAPPFIPMLVVVFIPSLAGFAVSIWGFVEIGCLRGNAGPNKYGSNPLSVPAARG